MHNAATSAYPTRLHEAHTRDTLPDLTHRGYDKLAHDLGVTLTDENVTPLTAEDEPRVLKILNAFVENEIGSDSRINDVGDPIPPRSGRIINNDFADSAAYRDQQFELGE